ncbi:MAG TPA: HAD family phosphatase [Stellaceae bacterium]|nr:HAD family phosphatase [Stellaceae bacterium]
MRLIIFDFDGVVADSEHLAMVVMAEGLSGLGLPTTADEAVQLYMGLGLADCVRAMEARLGAPLPDGFMTTQIERVRSRVLAEVEPVQGLTRFLTAFAQVRRCIASSSKLDYIGHCLDRMMLADWFEHRSSGHDVERGKPHPDLFLKAAATLGVSPSDCVVIEDSPTGVMAGKAAGMFTFGLCAGRHIGQGHADRLTAAGADLIAESFDQIAKVLRPKIARAIQ